MLSRKQQQLLVEIFMSYMKDGVNKRDVKEIYCSYVSFYRATKYLIDSGLLVKHRDHNHKSFYKLTLKGEVLARIVGGLRDMPEEVKQTARRLRARW